MNTNNTSNNNRNYNSSSTTDSNDSNDTLKKTNKQLENIKSLKDLNSSDKTQLSSVMHGRKASTYLRIFRDESITTKDEDDNIEKILTPNSSPQKRVGYKHKNRTKIGNQNNTDNFAKDLISSRINSSTKRGDSPSLSPKTKSTNISSAERSFSNNNSSIYSQDDSLSSQIEDLTLKPVSSATYYPHNSMVNSQPNEAFDQLNNNEIKIDQIVDYQEKNNINKYIPPVTLDHHLEADVHLNRSKTEQPKNISRLKKTDIQEPIESDKSEEEFDNDNNGDEDEDDDEDDREYPLAVELKPFTNKVGGHTAIFRFSKRAVCKALVKRENRWYETMELTNHKLLEFMPRYIGVLNVRQHFCSKEDFLNQLPTKVKSTESTKDIKMESINTVTGSIGAPLQHIHSIVTSSPQTALEISKNARPILTRALSSTGGHDHAYPEVVIDDNKHIIPDSLWDRCALSPDGHRRRDSICDNHASKIRNRNSGYTTINTKLKDLILQEVFAPIYNIKGHDHDGKRSSLEIPTRTVSGRYMKKKNRSSSSSSSSSSHGTCEVRTTLRRDSNFSLKDDQISNTPLMNKSTKDVISNAIDSSNSVMDLQQLHKKESARENATSSGSNIHMHNNSHSHPHSSYKRDSRKHNRPNQVDECSMVDSSGVDEHNTENPTPPSDSVSFEENTDTIVSKFILLEDLTRHMIKPCALDLKMGTRQYGVDAASTKQLSQRMKCLKTTSRKLGVRICGLKVWNKDYYIKRDKYFGRRVRVGWQFTRTLARFLYDGSSVRSIVRSIPRLIKEIDSLASEIANLKGFRLYGASLLLMYDGDQEQSVNQSSDKQKKNVKIKVNLIDFAKCVTREDLQEGIKSDSFAIPPRNPDYIDVGFYRGLKSLKFYLLTIWNYLTIDEPMVTNEEELKKLLMQKCDLFNKSWDWLDAFDKEDESEFNDPKSELRKKWRKYELIFDVEPRYNNDEDVSD